MITILLGMAQLPLKAGTLSISCGDINTLTGELALSMADQITLNAQLSLQTPWGEQSLWITAIEITPAGCHIAATSALAPLKHASQLKRHSPTSLNALWQTCIEPLSLQLHTSQPIKRLHDDIESTWQFHSQSTYDFLQSLCLANQLTWLQLNRSCIQMIDTHNHASNDTVDLNHAKLTINDCPIDITVTNMIWQLPTLASIHFKTTDSTLLVGQIVHCHFQDQSIVALIEKLLYEIPTTADTEQPMTVFEYVLVNTASLNKQASEPIQHMLIEMKTNDHDVPWLDEKGRQYAVDARQPALSHPHQAGKAIAPLTHYHSRHGTFAHPNQPHSNMIVLASSYPSIERSLGGVHHMDSPSPLEQLTTVTHRISLPNTLDCQWREVNQSREFELNWKNESLCLFEYQSEPRLTLRSSNHHCLLESKSQCSIQSKESTWQSANITLQTDTARSKHQMFIAHLDATYQISSNYCSLQYASLALESKDFINTNKHLYIQSDAFDMHATQAQLTVTTTLNITAKHIQLRGNYSTILMTPSSITVTAPTLDLSQTSASWLGTRQYTSADSGILPLQTPKVNLIDKIDFTHPDQSDTDNTSKFVIDNFVNWEKTLQ